MGFLHNSPMGEPSGKIGNVVYRKRNGKIVVSAASSSFKTPQTLKAKTVRNNFSKGAKFSSYINSILSLREIWSLPHLKKRLSSFNRISAANIPLVIQGKLTPHNTITPDGFCLDIDSMSITDDELSVSFTFYDDSKINFPAKLYALFAFNTDQNPFHLTTTEIKEPNSFKFYSCKTKLESCILFALKEDPRPLVYFALIGSSAVKGKTYWSETVGVQN